MSFIFTLVDMVAIYFFKSLSDKPKCTCIYYTQKTRCQMFYNIGVLKNFAKFTGKHMYRSIIQPATWLKKRLRHWFFPVNFSKLLRSTFSQNTRGRMLLNIMRKLFFLYQGFLAQTLTINRAVGEGRRGIIFYSTLPLSPAHEHWDIYLQLCIWDDYHVFLIATLEFTRLSATRWDLPPYRITIWLIDRWCNVCLLHELILSFSYSDFDMRNRWIWTLIAYHPCITKRTD